MNTTASTTGDDTQRHDDPPIADIATDLGLVLCYHRGGFLKTECPFVENEPGANFYVRPDLGRFHCFGCGEGGDVTDLVMKLRGMTYLAAVEWLARHAPHQAAAVLTCDVCSESIPINGPDSIACEACGEWISSSNDGQVFHITWSDGELSHRLKHSACELWLKNADGPSTRNRFVPDGPF